jgi:hypothetical protein
MLLEGQVAQESTTGTYGLVPGYASSPARSHEKAGVSQVWRVLVREVLTYVAAMLDRGCAAEF